MRGVGEVREEVGMFKIIRRCELRLAHTLEVCLLRVVECFQAILSDHCFQLE